MAAELKQTAKLVQDEPWTFLNARHNPVSGRKLTYRLGDGTIIEIDVSAQEYLDPAIIKARLLAAVQAHTSVPEL